MLLDGFCNFIYNVLAFTLISQLSPVSYAIAGSTKRLIIITISILVLHNPVTKMNLFGISLALIGVVIYNQVIYHEKQSKSISIQSILPSPSP
jgi:solute carrier family 35 protein E1